MGNSIIINFCFALTLLPYPCDFFHRVCWLLLNLSSFQESLTCDTCLRESITGFYYKQLLTICIPAEPAFIVISSSPFLVLIGETVTLMCFVTLPPGVTGTPSFHWEGPSGVALSWSQPSSGRREMFSELNITQITPSHVGEYVCTATLNGPVSNTTTIPPLQSNQLTTRLYHFKVSLFLQFPRLLWLYLATTMALCMLELT